MVAIKARDVDAFLKSPDPTKKIILVFGPNIGLVSENVDKLIRAFQVDKSDSFSYQKIAQEQLSGQKMRLVEEAHAISMFADSMRVIHVRGSNASVTSAVSAVIASPPEDNVILIEAGDLQSRHGLRTSIDKSKIAASIPCYADDARSLTPIVNNILSQHNLSISPDVRTSLLAMLGDDRALVKAELDKLATACISSDQITHEDLEAHILDASVSGIDQVCDHIFLNQPADVLRALERFFDTNGETNVLAAGLSRNFQQLAKILTLAETDGSDSAVEKARPPIFFKRKPAFKASARRWNKVKMASAMTRIANFEKMQRMNTSIARIESERTCLELIRIGRN